MNYDVTLVTINPLDEKRLIEELSDDVFIQTHYLDTLHGKKSGWKVLNEFGTTKIPFICVKHKGTIIKCFYSDNSEDVISDFINWLYFNNMENTEVIGKVEDYLQQKINVKVQNLGTCKFPTYATKQSSGADLRAYLKGAVTLQPGERKLIPTGLHMSIPKGFELQVRPRSGLALKYGITVLNTPGTVDGDFTGDIGIILINFGNAPFTVYPGDKIAQGVFTRVFQANFEEVDSLEETERGSGGFGHTGV